MHVSAGSGFVYGTKSGIDVGEESPLERTTSKEMGFRIKSSIIIAAGACAMGAMWLYSVAHAAPTWLTIYIVVMMVAHVVGLSVYVEYLAGSINDRQADDASGVSRLSF